MAHLAGKFAGIVMVNVPEDSTDALIRDLEPLEARGLLDTLILLIAPIYNADGNDALGPQDQNR